MTVFSEVLAERVHELEAERKRLRNRIAYLTWSRDLWRRRAVNRSTTAGAGSSLHGSSADARKKGS